MSLIHKSILFSFIILGLISLSGSTLTAQSFGLGDAIEVVLKTDGSKCLAHTVQPKQTLYSISKFYGMPVIDILEYNNLTKNDFIYEGNKLYIPLRTDIVNTKSQITKHNQKAFPLVYIVKPKDNLYAISKRYFHISTPDLMINNNLDNISLNIGQELIIGWIGLEKNYSEWKNKNNKDHVVSAKQHNPVTSTKTKNSNTTNTTTTTISSSDQQESSTTKTSSNDNHIRDTKHVDKKEITKETVKNTKKKEFSTKVEKLPISDGKDLIDRLATTTNIDSIDSKVLEPQKTYIHTTGIALWSKYNSDKTNSFVLHPTAKNNSIIELYNPLTNRTAYAKVIGHLQPNIYKADVSIFISPKVAERLGALDERFKIKMTYYE